MKWFNKPITWGAYAILCAISLVVGIIGSLIMLADWCGGWRELWSGFMDVMPWNKKSSKINDDGDVEF